MIHENFEHPPGRPIILGINSLMCNHTTLTYTYKNWYVKLPSYVKDSNTQVRYVVCTENTSLLTLDVTSLYTNIDHELGIKAIKTFLGTDPKIPEEQWNFLQLFCIQSTNL